jgi:hypothetical protein
VRVGLITFSGEVDAITGQRRSLEQQDAWLEVPLTSDSGSVLRAVDAVVARGASGATNFAAGVGLAVRELAGLPGAASQRRPEAKQVILFLTDGVPSFPIGKGDVADAGDIEAAIAKARLAHTAGITINTYALGPQALAYPQAVTEMARVSLGSYTPVQNPGDIIALLQGVSFANIEDVAVANLTLREDTPDVRLNPDGSFQAFVPVREGNNRLLVNAVASDGSVANVELAFRFEAAPQDSRMRERELDQLRQLNTELLRHVEAERIKREKRRTRVQKEIEIRSEP